jgi:hypothetical protein
MKFEEYQKLASLLNEARKILYSHGDLGPKSKPKFRHYMRATKWLDEVRSESEELMFIDCPEQASVYIFYPGQSSPEELQKLIAGELESRKKRLM